MSLTSKYLGSHKHDQINYILTKISRNEKPCVYFHFKVFALWHFQEKQSFHQNSHLSIKFSYQDLLKTLPMSINYKFLYPHFCSFWFFTWMTAFFNPFELLFQHTWKSHSSFPSEVLLMFCQCGILFNSSNHGYHTE
jgi:hypothetical protein